MVFNFFRFFYSNVGGLGRSVFVYRNFDDIFKIVIIMIKIIENLLRKGKRVFLNYYLFYFINKLILEGFILGFFFFLSVKVFFYIYCLCWKFF